MFPFITWSITGIFIFDVRAAAMYIEPEINLFPRQLKRLSTADMS
jgi:hypothetical protein